MRDVEQIVDQLREHRRVPFDPDRATALLRVDLPETEHAAQARIGERFRSSCEIVARNRFLARLASSARTRRLDSRTARPRDGFPVADESRRARGPGCAASGWQRDGCDDRDGGVNSLMPPENQ
jgi:hypothetical protein